MGWQRVKKPCTICWFHFSSMYKLHGIFPGTSKGLSGDSSKEVAKPDRRALCAQQICGDRTLQLVNKDCKSTSSSCTLTRPRSGLLAWAWQSLKTFYCGRIYFPLSYWNERGEWSWRLQCYPSMQTALWRITSCSYIGEFGLLQVLVCTWRVSVWVPTAHALENAAFGSALGFLACDCSCDRSASAEIDCSAYPWLGRC